MECVDFVPAWYVSGSAVARRLEEILEGECDWGSSLLSVAEADCVLASLGLLHMRVKCVSPEALGGNYEPAVSACVPGRALRYLTNRCCCRNRFFGGEWTRHWRSCSRAICRVVGLRGIPWTRFTRS